MAEFLLEILSEEIPSRMQAPGHRSAGEPGIISGFHRRQGGDLLNAILALVQ